MAESRTERRRRQRKERKELQAKLARKPWPSKLWILFDVTVVLVSAYVLFFQVPANFSPSSQTLISRFDPFSTQFTFLNDGYMAAYNVRPSCGLASVTTINETTFKRSLSSNFIKPIPIVRSKDRMTIPCTLGLRTDPIKEADIAVILSFSRSLTFWDTKQSFRYKLAISSSGEPSWLPQPLD